MHVTEWGRKREEYRNRVAIYLAKRGALTDEVRIASYVTQILLDRLIGEHYRMLGKHRLLTYNVADYLTVTWQ